MPAAWKLSHLGKTMESGKPESVKSVAPRAYVNTQKPNTKAASLLFATSVFLLSLTIVLSNFPSPFLASYPSNEYPLSHFPSKASLYSARPGDRPLRKAPAYRILQLPQSRTCHLLSNETSCWGKGIPSSICSTLSPHSLAFLSPRIYNRPIRLDRIVPMAPSMLLSKRDCNQYDGTDCWDGSDWWWSSVSIHGSSRAQDSG